MRDHPIALHPVEAGADHPIVIRALWGRGADDEHRLELIQGRAVRMVS